MPRTSVVALSAMFDTQKTSRIDEHTNGRLVRITRQALQNGGWVSTHDDITDQQRAARELDQTKKFLDSIIETIPISVVVKDAKTFKYVLVNRAFEVMHDMPRAELLDRTVLELFGHDDAERIHGYDLESLEAPDGVVFAEQEVNSPKSGAMRIQATSRIVLRDNSGEAKYLIVVIDDITERRKIDQRIAFLAHHDALTGLANRAALTQKIEEAAARQRRRSEPFSVLLLDLDRFKQVNDTLDHPAGDTLADRSGRALERDGPRNRRAGAARRRRIRHRSRPAKPIRAKPQPGLPTASSRRSASRSTSRAGAINIGASIGIALAPEHDTSSDNLLKMADLALYRAKSAAAAAIVSSIRK